MLTVILLWLVGTMICGCSEVSTPAATRAAPEMPTVNEDGFPRLDGSTSAAPLGAKILCAMMDVPCNWVEFVDGNRYLMPDLSDYQAEFPGFGHSGTHSAYLNLINGEADMILVARTPSAEEMAFAQASGVTLDIAPIALDAFVFMVNETNPVQGLSTTEIRDIYSGNITNWQQVGGPPSQINPYQRDDQSGSQQLMRSMVMKGAPMIDAPDLILLNMIAPFYAISEDPHGIGYSVFYYEENMAPNEKIKLIAVNGVQPSLDSIRKREYPFTSEVYAVMRAGSTPTTLEVRLRDWLLSPEGQDLVAKSGYASFAN